jgi:hypothetical protein
MIPQVIPLRDNGRLNVDRGVHARYKVEKTGLSATPVSLTIQCYSKGKDDAETPINDLSCDSTLYFDREGKIVDRAPMRPWTTARKMQDRYADKLLSRMRGVVDRPEMKYVIKGIEGFFQGEEGIKRTDTRHRKKLILSWL